MELQLTIRGVGGGPLGAPEAVGAALTALFPGLVVEPQTLSGPEQLAALEAEGLTVPAALQAALGPVPVLMGGEFQGPELAAAFCWASRAPVRELTATLAGAGPAIEAALGRLAAQPGWVVGPGEGRLVPNAEPGAAPDPGPKAGRGR